MSSSICYKALLLASFLAAAEAFFATAPVLRGDIRARGGESACAAQAGESVVSRRGFAFGLVGAAVVLPAVVSAEESKGSAGEAASDAPKSDGGVKECDAPAKPKGAEVCEADY